MFVFSRYKNIQIGLSVILYHEISRDFKSLVKYNYIFIFSSSYYNIRLTENKRIILFGEHLILIIHRVLSSIKSPEFL